MGDISTEEALESNILYELLIYAEWQQEPEIQSRAAAERQDEKNQSSSWRFLEPLFSPFSCPPNLIQQLTKLQMPWQFAVGGDGKVVAILQDQTLEIRSARDEYGSVIGRSTVPKDPYPQWRKLLWSPDCTMLALGFSNGNVGFFDLLGTPLFSIATVAFSSVANASNDLSLAIAGMVFTNVQTKNTQWSFEFLVANHKGKIFSFLVSSTDGYQERHSFNFSFHHPNGITALCYHQTSNLLLVSGRSHRIHSMDQSNKALQKGISAWRILSDYPHYKLVTSLNDDLAVSKKSWWDVVRSYRLPSTSYQDVIFKMSISPSGDVLAAIHMSGALSLWNLPSLRLRKSWDLQLQPNYTDINPQYCEPGMKRKAAAILSDPLRFHIIDVNWWSNEALILVRCCGAVTVSSVYSLKNLLGISPEWFEPSAQASSFCDRGFLAMECESSVSTKKRRPSGSTDSVDGSESSDDEDYSVFSRTTEIAKKMLYFVTDSERFQPPRKKPKFINKTYRLLCLKSTTPEELFTRKINNEEYGEALALAKTYDLDCDLVYQRQWRKTTVSVASIQDYLSKITKRSWVLHECLERVPETIDAARELLMYGLCGTDLEALVAIGKGEDHGRFIVSEYLDDMYNMYSITSDEEEEGNKRETENKRRSELLKQINFKKLTLEQKQLCQCRLKLLTYLDRLNTYEIILGGPGVAEEHYDHMFFKQFRLQSGLEASIIFAQASNWRAVSAMFTYHGEETLVHRLPVLSNFPEITSPVEYQSMLPKLEYPKDNQISPWSEDRLRNPDWCEVKYPRQCSTPLAQDFVVDFYEENKHLLKYRQRLSGKLLTEWFTERAKEIETRSNLVDNALELIKLGIERNIKGLEKLLDDFITMEVLIYECHVEKNFSFKNMEQMCDFDKLQLLMSQCTEENFVKNARQWLVPFLNRCESHEPGSRKELLKRYLESLAKEGLNCCRKVFENSKPGQSDPIISDVQEVVSLALDCLYACERSDQLKDACIILDCIQANLHSFDQAYKNSVSHLISMLENHIRVAELLENNGVAVTLGFIRSNWNNVEEVKKLLTKVTRLAGRRHPVLDESQWRNLLHDILEMQKMLFSCITFEDCYEIFLQSLLCSGQNETIALAGKMMQCSQKQRKERESIPFSNFIYWYKLPYARSVNLVLLAAQEHFNSSANVSDPCMALAKSCLNLIEDVPSSIEMELDLISSLSLLQEFNVSILPLQVRLCSERITLINQALKNKGNAYKNVQKLLQLAYLLRVCGNNKKEREGKVLSLVASTAFSAKDYDTCVNVCKRLIEGGHEEGWKVCYSLGGCTDFPNIAERCELMSFAVAHCTPDLLEDALKSKMELHLQTLYDRIKFLMGDDFDQNTREESPEGFTEPESPSQEPMPDSDASKYSLWHTGEKTLQVLHHTRKTTKVVLSSMGSSSFWKDAVRWIPLGLQWNGNNGDDSVQNNKDLKLQGVCAFYSGLFGNAHISKLETSYQRYARQDLGQSLEIASSLVRAAFTEDTLKVEAEKSRIDMRVLLDLAKACLPEDATLCLAYLLSLKKVEDAEEIFKTLPSTPVVLQFACLYYAMKLCSSLGLNHVFSAIDEFQEDPSNVIRQVLDSMKTTEANHSIQPNEVETALHHLNKYNNMLYDFIQAEILHSIGGGVDAVRFAKDDVYKQETILGIAMTLDDSVFDIAVSLAHHYKLPLWDVYMAHLEHLFSVGSLSASEIEARVEKIKLLDVLLTDQEKFRDRLVSYVYPNIEGKNHPVLLLYYSFLEQCGDKPDGIGIAPSSHAKLIAKFRKAIPSLDYKLLLKPVVSPLNYLSTLMNESNIHVLAKVASKIPTQNGEFLTPSALYCAWGKKYFFEGKDSGKKRLLSTSEWLHRYEACGDIVQRMNPADVIDFFNYIIFSEMAVEMLNIDCRIDITKRGIKHCRQRSSKSKEDTANSEWKEAMGTLEHNIQHLQRLEDEMLAQLRTSSVPEIRLYAKEFDMSRCVPENLRSLLVKVVMAGTDLSVLQTFLSFCPSDLPWEPGDAYMEAISVLLKQMKYPEVIHHPYLDHKSPVFILEKILGDVYKYKDELMIEDVIIEQLHEYCSDDEAPVSSRLSVLEVLEKLSTLPEEYRELLLLYRTQALVSSTWPEYDVCCEDVTEESKRTALFNRLLESSCFVHHYHILAAILCHWPAFEPPVPEDPTSNPWTKVLCALAELPEKKGLDEMVKLLDKIHSIGILSEPCCFHVYKELRKGGSFVHKMKFALKTDYESLHEMAVEELSGDAVVSDGDIDDELLELILKQHIVSQIVNTNLYSPVIEYLVNHQEECATKTYLSGDQVVNELASAGHTYEAGSLLMILNGTHLGLSTFSSAAHVLQRWLSSARS